MRWRVLAAAAAMGVLAACSLVVDDKLARIDTIVVIYAENRSFDHLFGLFPGANGIAQATLEQSLQRDHDGSVLPTLKVWGADGKLDPAFPVLPNRPFQINAPPVARGLEQLVPSPIHAFYHHREQIDGGRNDRFAAMSNVGGWAMGYFDASSTRLWSWAQDYTLADNFFIGAYGGSFLNHFWLICACTPVFPDAPQGMRAELDPEGRLARRPDSPSARDGAVRLKTPVGLASPDGYAVNTVQPPYQPSGIPPVPGGDPALADPGGNRAGKPLPPQTMATIGDRLSAKGIDWAWYAGGWSAALSDARRPPGEKRQVIYSREPDSPNFQAHHQPFNYFARFAPGSPERERHLKDAGELFRAIDQGDLPPVVFYKPAGRVNQHPGTTNVLDGDRHIDEVLELLRHSPQWPGMLIIVTYDENGGWWDHVPPPQGPGWSDRWGPGSRVPTLIISPLVRQGAIDSTPYDTTSILKLITRRFDLKPLPGVRENMGDLTAALE